MDNSCIDYRLPTTLVTKTTKCVEYINATHQMLRSDINDTTFVHSRMRYIITPFLINRESVEQLLSFFRVCKGSLYAFRFKDISDYKVEREVMTCSDEKRKEYYAKKRYHVNRTYFEFRHIKKIVHGTVDVFMNHEKVDPKMYEVNHDNGMIYFYDSVMDNVSITCSFEFDVLVRFAQDSLHIEMHNPTKFHCDNIELIEVK
ncbi:putative family 24 glycoside hydrolase [Candidatus Fokinia solitaria]|uniref:Putative family 24 glycoside hydrolase n=1 Tax=Candidatus Fokinia solitaria TaxID=1802984 RepID=A0A2U8BS24_9RICK|nr:DUF2460 domain-containing protein [Candidatus Fokinia solitaria]AWD33080.1 putative family 24 glycoside hydrolase [Candidatus Fokinia solitaria]